ncbi:type III polyketide synthase [Alkalibacillus haloalkaliphilus]|uniref:type III polyketide synthase n=1 Tax=Alkalibacillus haloalkaliphilus TaxID=94136 RepID=UPI0029364D66|nr:3-oxoacyl-[acyl-carrier-protein] synthase III C-terminal domain-containing protein [Alkalibacillus haloalkaliphilus]MDV2580788.1 3-oxoacyl-[acyl-carrier-protein] synthase III C-terminal domain-containing protein [Alkalibacillus haloalkaliphilus]
MAVIASVGTSVPQHKFTQTFAKDVVSGLTQSNSLKKYLSVFDEAAIEERYFVSNEKWFKTNHGLEERHKLWLEEGVNLAKEAVWRCLGDDFELSDVDAVVSVTSTGILTPSMEVHLLNELNFSPYIKRMPLFGLGCAGGAIGLSRAFEYLKGNPEQAVLLISCELASVAFHPFNLRPKDIVGAAIFSDGAAATLLLGENHPKVKDLNRKMVIKATDSKVKLHSMNVMGWDVKDDGFHVIFDVTIPKLIEPFWKPHVDRLLKAQDLSMEEIKHIVAHPGGRKIIEEIERLTPNPNLLQPSRNVLKQYGNMSSPTVLFVLQEVMKQNELEKGYALLSALGPGFASEVVLMEVI